jgi:hypothetical protein
MESSRKEAEASEQQQKISIWSTHQDVWLKGFSGMNLGAYGNYGLGYPQAGIPAAERVKATLFSSSRVVASREVSAVCPHCCAGGGWSTARRG